MRRKVRLRERLREYAKRNSGLIEVDKFIEDCNEFSDLGLEEAVSREHVKQTLSRFAEFKRLREKVYKVLPDVIERQKARRRKAWDAMKKPKYDESKYSDLFG